MANPVTGTRTRSWRYTETRDKRELKDEGRDERARRGSQGEIEKFRDKQ